MKPAFKIGYLFRKPVYPLLVDIDGHLVAAVSERRLAQSLLRLELREDASYDVIDSSGEGWTFDVEHEVLSPLTLKRQWTKREVIQLYSGRKNNEEGEPPYPEKSLSSKRFDRIIADIVELLDAHRNL